MLDYVRMTLRSRCSERGATAVEYGLLIAVIAIVIIAGMTVLSGAINGLFESAGSELNEDRTTP